MITIRAFQEGDWDATWRILEPVFRAGESYPFSPEFPEEKARRFWVDKPSATFVAEDEDGTVVGTYFIKPNQASLGAHVCNCGYVVSEEARGQGIASKMCEHSQREALARDFRSMQFNFVISTNEAAIRLWKKQGFEVVGTLPEAFRHPRKGFVDAYVMFKKLVP